MGAHQLLGALDNCSPGETATAYKSQSWIVKSFAHRAAATGLRGEHTLAKETRMALNASQTTRARVKIAGRVQGVYFRASTCQEAQGLGVTGWVRNCSDGSVELVAEGPREKLDQLIAWCHRGPAGARVTEVTVHWEEPEHGYRGFVIKR